VTKSLFNDLTYNTKNCWHSVNAYGNAVSIYNLLPLIIEFIISYTYWPPYCQIETWPFGQTEPNNILVLVILIRLKFIHFDKWFIFPAILLFINEYSHVTAQYSPIIYLSMTFSVQQYKEPGKITLMHSVQLYSVPFIPPPFLYIDCR
jgi:hypothetical protein